MPIAILVLLGSMIGTSNATTSTVSSWQYRVLVRLLPQGSSTSSWSVPWHVDRVVDIAVPTSSSAPPAVETPPAIGISYAFRISVSREFGGYHRATAETDTKLYSPDLPCDRTRGKVISFVHLDGRGYGDPSQPWSYALAKSIGDDKENGPTTVRCGKVTASLTLSIDNVTHALWDSIHRSTGQDFEWQDSQGNWHYLATPPVEAVGTCHGETSSTSSSGGCGLTGAGQKY